MDCDCIDIPDNLSIHLHPVMVTMYRLALTHAISSSIVLLLHTNSMIQRMWLRAIRMRNRMTVDSNFVIPEIEIVEL